MDYLYKNIVIAPYYEPEHYYCSPSLLGCTGIKESYAEHIRGYRTVSRRIFTTKYEDTISQPCIFAGHFYLAYGHFLIETLSRLYFIRDLPPDYPLVFCFSNMGSREMFAWQKELLEIYGLKNPLLQLKRPTLFSDIYIPPPGATLDGYILPEQYAALQIQECKPEPGTRLYISRSRVKGNGGCRNEAEIDSLLSGRGWSIMYPEQLSVREQASRLASAEIVFGISGSAWHSLLLLENPVQRFVTIPRSHVEGYNVIAHAKSKDYWLLDIQKRTPSTGANLSAQWFDLDIEALAGILDQSDDFRNPEALGALLTRPPRPCANPWARPAWLDAPQKSRPADNLFYRILQSLHTSSHFDRALKIMIALVETRLFEPYMRFRCSQLLKVCHAPALETFEAWIKAKYHAKDEKQAALALVRLLDILYSRIENIP